MVETLEWFEDEAYWRTLAPVLFAEQRARAAGMQAIAALLGLGRGASILDVACGPGLDSLSLARLGLRVTGVDRTGIYIQWARRQAALAGLEIEFVQEDMRVFRRPAAFDATVSFSTILGYSQDPEDDRRVAENVYKSLRAGGVLLIDQLAKDYLKRMGTCRDWQEVGRAVFLLERRLGEDGETIMARDIYLREGQRREYRYAHRLYSAEGLSALLSESGFREVRLCGDLEGLPYTSASPRIVALARRVG